MVNLNKWTASTGIIWYNIDRYTTHSFPWFVVNDGKWAESVILWPESATICQSDTKCILTGRTYAHHVMVLPPWTEPLQLIMHTACGQNMCKLSSTETRIILAVVTINSSCATVFIVNPGIHHDLCHGSNIYSNTSYGGGI